MKYCEITEDDEREAAGLSEEEAQEVFDRVSNSTDNALSEFLETVPQSTARIRAALSDLYMKSYPVSTLRRDQTSNP